MCENMILMPNIFFEGEKLSNKYKNLSDPVGAPCCPYGISGYVRPIPKSQKKMKISSHKVENAPRQKLSNQVHISFLDVFKLVKKDTPCTKTRF